MRELSIFKRGQVWYIDDKRRNIGSIQGKSRPYLVVSNDKCNANSPVIHMAPLTTQDKASLPTHVQIYDPIRKLNQIILCEQVMIKSVPDITPMAEYRYTLTDEKMKEVDKAIAIQFGLPYIGVSLDDFEDLLDTIKTEKIAQIKAEADKLNNSRAEVYVNKLLEEVNESTTSSVPSADSVSKESSKAHPTSTSKATAQAVPRDSKPMSQVDKFNMRLQKTQNLQDKASNSSAPELKTNRRNNWTEKRKREFLSDVDNPNMTRSEVLDKYHMTSTTCYTMVSKFRRELSSISSIEESTEDSRSVAKKFLDDYDSKSISEMMELYGLPDKKAVITQAAVYRTQLGR